jgi:HK97 family phage major capsid protein
MPYKVIKENDKWYVLTIDTGEKRPKDGYPTEEEAKKFLGALEANVPDANKKTARMQIADGVKVGATFNKGNRDHLTSIKESAKALADHARQVSEHASNIMSRTDQMMPDPSQQSETDQYPAEAGEGAKAIGITWMQVNTQIIEGAIKAVGDWELDVLGVPFGGPNNGKDRSGEYFSPKTQTQHDLYPEIPVYYYHTFDAHGRPQGEPVIIGKASYNKEDAQGHWYKVILDKTKELAQRIWGAAQKGIAKASSGTIIHALRKEKDGEITFWPVVEMSLMDGTPGILKESNAYAVALPAAKAHFETAGITWVLPSDMDDTANEQPTDPAEAIKTALDKGQAGAATETNSNKEHEMGDENKVTTQAFTPEQLQQTISAAVAEGIKAFQKAQPAPDASGVTVIMDEADRPFRSLAEMARAVKMAEVTRGQTVDTRLLRVKVKEMEAMKAAQGANESVPADAGYLIEPTLNKELLVPIHEEGPFTSKVRKLPVSANSNFGYINGIDETSRANGSRWGGVVGYRVAEAGSLTSSRPKFRRINWELKKYAALMYATDELILDATQFSAVAQQSAGEELSFMANDDILNGVGTGGALGILNSGALIGVTRQDASKIQHQDILNMWQRILPRFRGGLEWFVNSEAEPQLDALYFTGTTSVLSPYVTYSPDGVMKIKGRPVNVTEFNPALNAKGDILLANLGEYLFWEKGDVQAATSIHIAFLTDEQAFRFIYRADGQTAHYSPITPFKGSNTQSAFVCLNAASA